MKGIYYKVPRKSPTVLAACKKLGLKKPFFVKVTPRDFAEVSQCHFNSMREAELLGGIVRQGWAIYTTFGEEILEAMFHSVVVRGGSVIDVTPGGIGSHDKQQRLFAFEPKLRFIANRPIPNRSLALDPRYRTAVQFIQRAENANCNRRMSKRQSMLEYYRLLNLARHEFDRASMACLSL